MDDKIKQLIPIFKKYPEVKLAYLFGSRANGKIGPLSDYDFAVYIDEKDSIKRFDIRLEIMGKLSSILKTDAIDLIVLNEIYSPELKFHVIRYGKVIYEVEPYKLFVEPQILNDFFDFKYSLIKYKLTKAYDK